MMSLELKVMVGEAKRAVKRAKEARKAWEGGKTGWEEFKNAAGYALAKVGLVLEDAYWGRDTAEREAACNKVRKLFGLGAMEDLPWDGASELVGWDVVVEKEG
jgi:hypothetical protein